ncbi:choice-of-anchor L domain-containing protein [Rhodohalobacter barkolensis]|uniref:Fibronectin type-III domain-containing protein n=1 Tax=Rhodohalobacter barkolensis TaxID=2053187 RepID=A0A2N0VKS2_9BACT|nr:choice-of-anchor L domain-containing protein [Rhodohalobacter barkolensis]PKD44764.1 hypothetical protein CWD77_04685 [Rhodohalobacter barkolensis]
MLRFILAVFFILSIQHQVLFGQERVTKVINESESVNKINANSSVNIANTDVIEALGLNEEDVISIDFLGSDQLGYSIFSQAASGFPIKGNSYLVLSSGCADLALDVDIDANVISCELENGPTGPGSATDIVRLKLELNVPDGANFLSFDFKFFSEEYPNFIGSSFNDGFIVEVGESTFTVDGSGNLVAPDNVVFDKEGNPITINDTGTLGQKEGFAAGTAYGRKQNGGATTDLDTYIPISPGQETISLIFSIFDVADRVYDSTVFIDNMQFHVQPAIELIALEVNQSIQNWNNTVPLIEDKPTIVRAHMQTLTQDSVRANVWLEGYDEFDNPLSPAQVAPYESDSNIPGYISAEEDPFAFAQRRATYDKSINFDLPQSWLNGKIKLKINGGDISCPDQAQLISTSDGGCMTNILEFQESGVPEITFFLIDWKNSDGDIIKADFTNSDLFETIKKVISMFPISGVKGTYRGRITMEFSDVVGDSVSSKDILKKLNYMWLHDVLEGTINKDHIYYGFINSGKDNYKGEANDIPGFTAYTNLDNFTISTTMHELGHAFGQRHAVHSKFGDMPSDGWIEGIQKKGPCAEKAAPWAQDFPFFHRPEENHPEVATLGPVENVFNESWGINTNNRRIATVSHLGNVKKENGIWGDKKGGWNAELMSYCTNDNYSNEDSFDDRWISSFTYESIWEHIKDRYGSTASNLLAFAGSENFTELNSTLIGRYLVVSGSIDFAQETPENSVDFSPIQSIVNPSTIDHLTPDPGDFLLRAVGGDGEVLYETSFEPTFGSDGSMEVGSFSIAVPYDAEIASIQVLYNETPLGSVVASANTPTVQLEYPVGGESISGDSLEVIWNGTDSDGGDLSYSLYYSDNAGESWKTVITDIRQSSYSVNTSNLEKSSEGRFRIQVSDGFNTAEDTTGIFSVPNSTPDAFILSPSTDAQIDTSAVITLRGSASDLEDGQLEGSSLEWRSDVDGFLGNGSVLQLVGSTLSRGIHNVTLKATDMDGAYAETSVKLEITAPSPTTTVSTRPGVQGTIPNQELDPNGDTFYADLQEIFFDPSEGDLTFEVSSSNENVASVSIDGNQLSLVTSSVGVSEIDVTAKNGVGNSTITFMVIVGNVNLPVLISPVDDGTDVNIFPELIWEGKSQDEVYHLQLSDEATFNSTLVDVTALTNESYQIEEPLDYGQTYYWRVQVDDDLSEDQWSMISSFMTESIPIPDSLAMSINDESVSISWDISKTVGLTDIHIYRGSSINNLELYDEVSPEITEYTDTDPTQGSIFYSLKAIDLNNSESEFSDILSYYNQVHDISNSWEMISLPIEYESIDLQSSQLFSFNRTYSSDSTIVQGKGYWIRSATGESLNTKGVGLKNTVIKLNEGWNLIGSLVDTVEVSSIVDSSNVLSNAPIMTYQDGVYEEVDFMIPSYGYWVHANDSGYIFLDVDLITENGEETQIAQKVQSDIKSDKILFGVGDVELAFHISNNPLDNQIKYRYLLPPKPPVTVLDIRSDKNYSILDNLPAEIYLTSNNYPVSVNLSEDSVVDEFAYRIIAVDENEEIHINLLPGQKHSISKEYSSLILERVSLDEMILETNIDQNFPNPFNPTTNIRYQIANQAEVSMVVYDLLGRRVATLVNQTQQPGIYNVQFDGSSLASGVYFLRIQAGSFVDIQKLTLIK